MIWMITISVIFYFCFIFFMHWWWFQVLFKPNKKSHYTHSVNEYFTFLIHIWALRLWHRFGLSVPKTPIRTFIWPYWRIWINLYRHLLVQILSHLPLLQEGTPDGFPALSRSHILIRPCSAGQFSNFKHWATHERSLKFYNDTTSVKNSFCVLEKLYSVSIIK